MRIYLATLTVAAAILQTGCFVTKVRSPGAASLSEETNRQWFTIGGLVPVSGPAGVECGDGIAYAESSYSAADIAINLGLTLAGSLTAGLFCPMTVPDPVMTVPCITAGAQLLPFFIQSRTVTHACVEKPPSPFVPKKQSPRPKKRYPRPTDEDPFPTDEAPEPNPQPRQREPRRYPIRTPSEAPETTPELLPLPGE